MFLFAFMFSTYLLKEEKYLNNKMLFDFFFLNTLNSSLREIETIWEAYKPEFLYKILIDDKLTFMMLTPDPTLTRR